MLVGMLGALLVRFGQCGLLVLKQLGLCVVKSLRWQRRKSIKSFVTPVFIVWGMLLMYQTYMLNVHEQGNPESSVSALLQKQQIDRIIEAKVNERLREQQTGHIDGKSLEEAFQAFADSRPRASAETEDEDEDEDDEEDAAMVNAETPDLAPVRSARKFIVIQPLEPVSRKKHKRHRADVALISTEQQGNIDVVTAALKQLGYQQASGLSDIGLMWIIALHLECGDTAVTTAMNSIPGATSSLVLLCASGVNFVDHFNRKVSVGCVMWAKPRFNVPCANEGCRGPTLAMVRPQAAMSFISHNRTAILCGKRAV